MGKENGDSCQSNEENWIKDDAKTREYDGKSLFIENQGKFLMRVSETNSRGERRPGYIQLLIEPVDLNAAVHSLKKRGV